MGADSRRVRRVAFRRGRARARRDTRRPFAMRLRGRSRTVTAAVLMRDGRRATFRARVPRRCR
jgi:hypothetical protein